MSAFTDHWHLRQVAFLAACLLCLAARGGLAADNGLDSDRAGAAAGDPEALVRMAERYEMADGVPFDLHAASALFELAAKRGDAMAQYRLGLLQAGGVDPDADLAEAYGWLRLAAENAKDEPTGLLARALGEALAGRLDAGAIERAEQSIAAFAPITGPAELPTSGSALETDRAALLGMLPSTGCGSPELQQREDGDLVLLAYAPTGSMVDGVITPNLRTDLASRGAAVAVSELSPAICMIREVASEATAQQVTAEVSLAGAPEGGAARLRDGDKLVIDIPPTEQPRFVAIDYVVHTGEVWHLYPNTGDDGYLPAGQSLRLGDGAHGPAWEVGAPFGEDLVLVTLSNRPVAADQPATEPADAYRARLSRRLQGAAPGGSLRLFEQVVAIEAR